MKALEAQIKEFDKAISAQMELLPNVLISISGIGPVYSAGIIAPRLEISIVLIIRPSLQSMQVLLGLSINLVTLKPKTQGLSNPEPIFKVLSV